MKKFPLAAATILLAGLLLMMAANASAAGNPAKPPVIDPTLAATLAAGAPNQTVSVIVILKDQVNVKAISGRNHTERQRNVIQALHQKADATQSGLRVLLRTRQRQGSVQAVKPLWVINAVAVTANSAVIGEVANLPEVQRIAPDATIQGPPVAPAATTPETNLSVVNAPAMWDLGFRGQGVVVASMDTGVDYTHPDLAAQWRGGSNSWYDPYGQHPTVPTDVSGHGTSTMGVMVGRDNGGTAIGVAPDASWIAVKIFNDRNVATTSAIHQGFQWLLDPDGNALTADAPDVVNNSWSFSSPGCDLTFEPDLQSLIAAGITPVFAAGNYGPNSSTSASPGNNPSAFSVGATDDDDLIASFSSRGPTSCGLSAPTTYPAVVAPGVAIRTSDLFGSYASLSGTSLAAPHVSGALALLLSARPDLTVEQQRAALTTTALDLGPAEPDDAYGAGRIDALAAYSSLTGGGTDNVGPQTSGVSLAPNPTNGSADVTLSATVDDSSTGGSNVVAAEYFTDAVGANGSGTAAAGAFGTPTVSVSATITAATLAALPAGPHAFYVHGQDELGNWGAVNSAVLNLDKAGPATTNISLGPSPTNGSVDVALQATGDDTATGNANVDAAEFFMDAAGADGTGAALTLTQPPAPTVGLVGTIPAATVAALSEGAHTVLAHSHDALGSWGPFGTVALRLDRTAPAVSSVSASPNPTAGATSVTLTAAAADGGTSPSNVVAAEWFEGADPGLGFGAPMAATNGTFDSPTEGLTATVNVTGWTVGNHTLSVRALDAAGNWGAVGTTTLNVQAADLLFADGFEGGSFSAWSSASGAGTRISVAAAAALQGAFGMRAVITGNTPGYVTDNSPANETSYHARFYFHPNSTVTRGSAHDIFVGRNATGSMIFRVQYRRTSGGLYQIRGAVLRSGGTTYTGWYTITNAAHAIEIAWQSASTASFGLYIDGSLKQTLSGLNTNAYRLDSVRLGPSAGLASGMSGTEYYDAFVSSRNSYIGP